MYSSKLLNASTFNGRISNLKAQSITGHLWSVLFAVADDDVAYAFHNIPLVLSSESLQSPSWVPCHDCAICCSLHINNQLFVEVQGATTGMPYCWGHKYERSLEAWFSRQRRQQLSKVRYCALWGQSLLSSDRLWIEWSFGSYCFKCSSEQTSLTGSLPPWVHWQNTDLFTEVLIAGSRKTIM